MTKLLYLLLFLTLPLTINSLSKNCLTGCDECVEPKSLCVSCRNDFELSSSGQCIANTISNCTKYQNRLICSRCRPSFRLLNNRCIKMNDGCLESGQFNLCSNCVENAILDKTTSTCLINELNCEQLGRNRRCIKCKPNYRLDSTKNVCIFNSSICARADQNTGLCVQCAVNFTLYGFECFRTSIVRSLTNCYLTAQNKTSGSVECIYCKEGYLLINGICTLKSFIIDGNKRLNCSQINEYIDISDSSCKPVPKNCKFFDYGFKKCVFCQNGRVLMDGVCKKDVHKNCAVFSATNPELCTTCKQRYYLNQDSQCIIFPPFCQEVSSNGKCLRCMDSFLLTVNTSLCVDPNCFQINRFNGECNQCKNTFVKNIEGICTFVDTNCEQKRNQVCIKCKQNFFPNNQTGICEFRDPNCATFSNKNICLQCNQQFYYNINSQRCLKLPENCQSANERGQCRQCVMGFVLTSGRQCVKINSIPNCKIGNSKSPNLCFQCEIQYYLTSRGNCQLLPIFCLEFDITRNQCRTCDLVRSRLEDGICKDKNCEFIDFDGTCLGCFQGYQFGLRGECQIQQRDPNCKEFLHDQCRTCSDRYYFDKNWQCVPVSSLCQDYNQNSGLCTSCYPGYRLSEEPQGECIVGDPIFNPCKDENKKTGDCIKCADAYELAKTDTNKVVCTKIDLNLSNSCLEFKNKKCSRCIASRFLKDGQCEQIDQKCMKYDKTTGQCEVCYEGYELKIISKIATNETKQVCLFKAPADPNCKSFDSNHSSLCVECYSGYQVSPETNKCELYQDFCQTRNKQGQCVSCFVGYKLINNLCVVSVTQSTKIEDQFLPLEGCNTPKAADPKLCDKCVWGYVKKEGQCFKKDGNCKVFKDENTSLECLQCYPGYDLMPNNPNVCVIESEIDRNCEKYDENNVCSKCKVGYKLQVTNLQNVPKCQSIRKDINCVKYSDQGVCEQCLINMIITESGKCEYPLYGFDINCEIYKDKICAKCKQTFVLNQSFICISQN